MTHKMPIKDVIKTLKEIKDGQVLFYKKEALEIAIELLSTNKSEWISVSESLPEDAYRCLVTVYDTDLRTQDEFKNILPYFVGYDGETWNNADGEPIPFEVIAWMPLPEPYKAESEEEE